MRFFFVFVFIFSTCWISVLEQRAHTHTQKKSVSNLIILLLPFAYNVFSPLYSYSMLLIKVFQLGNKLLILMSLRANKIMESSAFKKISIFCPCTPKFTIWWTVCYMWVIKSWKGVVTRPNATLLSHRPIELLFLYFKKICLCFLFFFFFSFFF